MENHKRIMRKMVLELRDSLDRKKVEDKSRLITGKLMELKEYKSSSVIMCYVDFKNEVITRDFIKKCIEDGKRVAVPMVSDKTPGKREIIASEILSIDKDLEPGRYGILEPKSGCVRAVDPSEIDLVVVPGVVFDIRRNRLGYGAGYYDRFLKKLKIGCMKVGVAFDFQIADEVPVDRYDVPLNMIITENTTI